MSLDSDINDVQQDFRELISESMVALSLSTLTNAVLATPVGNPTLWQNPKAPPGYVGGRARANWQVGVGVDPKSQIDRVDASGSSTITNGKSDLNRYRDEGTVFISNNLPYMPRLNDGHSTQAPVNFLEAAAQKSVEDFPAIFERILRDFENG